MSLVRLRVAVVLAAATIATGHAFQSSQANRPWPPGVQPVPDQSPALSPAEALQTFYMPPGYHLELVAAEPLVQDPIAMDWDPDGRLWVVEMPGFVPDLAAPEPNMAPIGRIVVLQDTDHDGRMDTRTVFADGLVLARSVKVLDHGVLVAEPPNVWLMHDTDGDLKMDTKELVTDTYGRRQGRVEQNANGFTWAMDNWMHTANADVFLRWKNGAFEVRQTLSRGEWGASQDDAGRIYRNTNSEALHVDFVPTAYYDRDPALLRTRGSYDRLDDAITNEVWPVRPNVATNRSYQFGILRPDRTLAAYTSICAPLIYRGDRLPAELRGNVFAAEPAANVVSRFTLNDDGRTLRLNKAYGRAEFLASTDERFRPVFLSDAPDGTIYIVDMYRGVIQQRADITEYLRDQIRMKKLESPTGLGRIYRVMHQSTTRDSPPQLSHASTATLVETLSHPNGWRRDTAQRLLVERGDRSAVAPLEKAATAAADWRTRVHALWTLDGIDAITPAVVLRALADPSRDVRVSAVRVAERFVAEKDGPVQAALLGLLDDPDWNVQQQLAASLGALPAGSREAAIAAVLERHGDKPVVMDAALSGTRGVEVGVLRLVLQATARTPQREAAITMLAATLVRGALDANIQSLFEMVADDSRPGWQRSDLLRGAEVALLATAMPGSPGRGRAAPPPNAPCSTCPGGRAGPGGAYAFEQVPTAGRGNANGRRSVRLNREPVVLTALSTGGGELAARAAGVLARVEWPGKPGMAAPIAPLSAADEVRFNAGAEVYKNICITCHQPDGRGQEKLAASLVGSTLALASPDVPARILLNGKEGPIGLMPPVGSVLSDDQIAAVLTYIRREWGQGGTAVDPAVVTNVRALVAGRTKPWTNAELLALIK